MQSTNMKILLFLFFYVVFCISSVFASSPRDGGGANSQSQALIQQLGMERTRLNAENAKLKKQIKNLEGQLEELNGEKETAQSQLTKTQQQLSSKTQFSDDVVNRLKDAKSKMEELIGKFRETISNLRQVENESAQRAQEITRLEQELNSCATSNVELSKLGLEVLDNYENKGFWDRAGQKEPFTQLKRVQIENIVDDYTFLIQDQEYNAPEDLQTISE